VQTFAEPERPARSTWHGLAVLLPALLLSVAVSLLVFKILSRGSHGALLTASLLVLAPLVTFVPLLLFSAACFRRMERERRQSEQQLRGSTERLSSVLASAMDALNTHDDSMNIIVFNQAAEQIFGCPASDALGKPLDRFLPAPVRDLHHSRIQAFGETGVTNRSMGAPGILSGLRANGEQFPIEATISQVQVSGQKLYTVILRDVTGRMRAEETLRDSEARFRSIYEQAAVGITQIALDGQLLMANAALCHMLGYEESELLGRKIEDITDPDDRARESALLSEMVREHRRSYDLEKRYRHRDGSQVWVHVTSSMVRGPEGSPLYRISVIQNLTERNRAQELLKQAQKMEAIGRLAGGVAHDFNTLLNVMLGYSDLLLAELPEGDVRRERVIQIKNSGEAGAMLTRQLLAFSRKQAIAEEVLDLRAVASSMTSILERLLREDIELTVKCGAEPCPVKVDPGQIQQLVLNLAANAGDAMPHGGQVSIEVRAIELDETYVRQHPTLSVGRYAMLAISDSGSGMDAQTVAHIFEPFFTTKDAGKGTGLGLATVYAIAKRNRGDIWVYSEPGVGTIFKVLLPVSVEEAQKPQQATPRAHGASMGGETILLVEDSAALRELTRVILLRHGYNVLEAEDGIAALEISGRFADVIDLVLTDVVMPRMRGPELAAEIMKQRPQTAVVFLSGYNEDAIAQAEGIAGFTLVEKPYTADALLDSIRRVLDGRPLPDKLRVS
jgi:PAS domain S-box-containing protein